MVVMRMTNEHKINCRQVLNVGHGRLCSFNTAYRDWLTASEYEICEYVQSLMLD